MQRVARYIYLQTPNLYFPIEPHDQLPLIQFLPLNLKLKILSFFNKTSIKHEYSCFINNPINLLSIDELRFLFNSQFYHIYKERFFILTKSFIVYSKVN